MTNELNERFSPMHVKQAIGIASDKRYAGGNMTGAVKAIEKMKKGLSDHPQVRAVLKRQNEDVNEKFDPADFDMVATDKDKAGAKMNIIMQLRKAADVRGNLPIQFADGKKAKLPPKVIELALKKFASFRKPDAKEKLQTAMGKSYKDMVHALKTMREETELDEALQHVHTIKITADAPSDAKPSEVADIKNDFKLHVQAIRGAVKRLGGLITDTEVPSRQNKFVGKIKIGTRGDASKISIPVIQRGVKSGGIELDKRQFVREEVELDEARPPQIQKGKAKGTISATGIRGKGNKKFDVMVGFDNGKFSFRITDESGRFQTVGIKQASKMLGEESVADLTEAKLNEAKNSDYTIYHKTFSSAVQHAIAVAKKRGYAVDEDDWDRKVAMGPRKPSKGKTNSYSINLSKNGKDVRQKLQMQVYYDQGRYELNMYIS